MRERPAAPNPTADRTALLGRYTSLFDEILGQSLTLEDARERLAAGQFQRSTADVPNVGNRAPPRRMHLSINNPGARALGFRIYVA